MARSKKHIQAKFENVDILLINLSLLGGPVLRRGSKLAITNAALHLEGKLKEKLSRAGSGIMYYGSKGSRGRTSSHRASAPGEPPAPWYGELRASVTHSITGGKSSALPAPGGTPENVRAHVGTPLARGFALEAGYHGRPYGNLKLPLVYVAPRPWFYNTIEQEKGAIRNIIVATLKNTLATAKLKKSKRRRR